MKNALYDNFDYIDYWTGREYENQAELIAINRLLTEVPKIQKETLLDIGGGFGRLTKAFAHKFKKCLLVDPSKKLLHEAEEYLKGFTNVDFKEGEAEKLPVREGRIDVVFLVRVVHHLDNPYLPFLEAYRVLKPQGFLILEFANKTHFRACLRSWIQGDLDFTHSLSPADQRRNKESQVPFFNHHPEKIKQQLERAGFKVIKHLSVSNFRYPILKYFVPIKTLLFLESHFSLLSSYLPFLSTFGPSIFLLAKKP